MGIFRRRTWCDDLIPVTLPPAPPPYISKVKEPGEVFLRANPVPTSKDWSRHNYWRFIHSYLYKRLGGICVYCASWTPRHNESFEGTDSTSIDHFVPKSINPQRAYDWNNFRLCRARLNNLKGEHTDVLDPCAMTNRCFMLDFSTFLIKPAHDLSASLEKQVRSTIKRLRLNEDGDYVAQRIEVIRDYSLGKVPINKLRMKYPFIAEEIVIQGFDLRFRARWAEYFKRPTIAPKT